MSIDTTTPAPDKTDDAAAPIVSVLTGNRFCTGCGYNLIGQAVVREPVYDLLIARCPECGAAAAVTEYPTLGQWGRRWAAILGGLWTMFLVALLIPTVASITALSLNFGEEAAREYRQHISQLFDADRAKGAEASTPAPAAPTPGPPDVASPIPQILQQDGQTIVINPVPTAGAPRSRADFRSWWNAQDPAQVFRAAGPWPGKIETQAFLLWIPGVFIAFIFGTIWSVVLIHLKRRWLPVVAIIVFTFVSVIATIAMADLQGRVPSSVYVAARQAVTPTATWLAIAGFTASLIFGMMLGRPIVRGLLRLLLAPRVRGNFAVLWTSEGLAPPGTGR